MSEALAHRPAHGGHPATQATGVDADLVAAIAWCRLDGQALGRPKDDGAFGRALALGLLAQDPCWRATERGEGVLLAAGLLKGEREPEQKTIHVLWASCERYSLPQFVAAWSDGLVECWSETYQRQRAEAETFFRCFGDEDYGWTFWTTVEELATPEAPDA
jgi:hypothetical protein